MFRLPVLLALMLSAPSVFASVLHCTGHYWTYTIDARTRISSSAVSGPVLVNISGPFGFSHASRFDTVSSEVLPGQSIKAQVHGSEGAGSLNVTFTGGNTYQGIFDGQTAMGQAQVNVTCTTSNSLRFAGH